MLNSNLRRLAEEFGFETITESLEQEVSDKLTRQAKLDDVETVTFGLETDDGKIVKVFVNKDDAEKFEKLMADALGSTDSVEEAINKAAGEVDIVDVEWPEADDEEEEIEGAEVMDPKVHSRANKQEEVAAALKPRAGGLSGSIQGVVESKISHLGDRLTTADQQLIYQAIIDLGVPEDALSRSSYRANIIKGIRETALLLATAPQMKIALKQLIKNRLAAEHPKAKDKKDDKKAGLKDSQDYDDEKIILESATTELYWSTFSALLGLFDNTPGKKIVANFLGLPKVASLQSKSMTKLQRGMTATVRTKLQALGVAIEQAVASKEKVSPTPSNPSTLVDNLSVVDIVDSISKLLMFGQAKGANLAQPALDSTQGKELLRLVRSKSSMLQGQVKRQLELLLIAMAGVSESVTPKAGEGYQLGHVSFDEGQAEKAKKALENRVTVTLVTLDGQKAVLSPRKPVSFIKLIGSSERGDITPEQIEVLNAAFSN